MRLTAENLAARRGDDLLFVNVSFQLGGGEALVVTGPNGSGKSTLLRVIAGLLRPETGRVTFSPSGSTSGSTSDTPFEGRAAEACHYLGHRNAMKPELTVDENLSFWKSFLGDFSAAASADSNFASRPGPADDLGPAVTGLAVPEAADAVGLGGIIHLPFGYLSAGQQRRFAMAKLLVAYRPVWILDEPTAALDSSADSMFAGLVRAHLASGGIAIAATHQPLGLEGAKELRMSGFAGVTEEVWG
jgi:heme exporter protein A